MLFEHLSVQLHSQISIYLTVRLPHAQGSLSNSHSELPSCPQGKRMNRGKEFLLNRRNILLWISRGLFQAACSFSHRTCLIQPQDPQGSRSKGCESHRTCSPGKVCQEKLAAAGTVAASLLLHCHVRRVSPVPGPLFFSTWFLGKFGQSCSQSGGCSQRHCIEAVLL